MGALLWKQNTVNTAFAAWFAGGYGRSARQALVVRVSTENRGST